MHYNYQTYKPYQPYAYRPEVYTVYETFKFQNNYYKSNWTSKPEVYEGKKNTEYVNSFKNIGVNVCTKEPSHKTRMPAVKYIRKNREQSGTTDTFEVKADTNLHPMERVDSPPTSCSSAESKSTINIHAAAVELQSMISGKSESHNECYFLPKIRPITLCQTHLIPMPSFILDK